MGMILKEVAPIGRSFEEYILMFGLTEKELNGKILCVADGPASFNAKMKSRGKKIISVDPIYQFSGSDIQKRFDEVIDGVIEQVRSTPGDWTWDYHISPERLRENREIAMTAFTRDFESGKDEGRYITGELPKLDFEDDSFDIALCSHFLFLYSDHFDYDFHIESVRELMRVAGEVRIFPLLDLMLNRSRHLEPIKLALMDEGYSVEIEKVEYEMQRGGNEMMRVYRKSAS